MKKSIVMLAFILLASFAVAICDLPEWMYTKYGNSFCMLDYADAMANTAVSEFGADGGEADDIFNAMLDTQADMAAAACDGDVPNVAAFNAAYAEHVALFNQMRFFYLYNGIMWAEGDPEDIYDVIDYFLGVNEDLVACYMTGPG